ncbi:MAG: glutamine amidotransferase [Nitrospirae bacterium]|nr:glutamine amidotransferase [Nitrospirota bacterium]MCL5285824.1 glutamine amidotransferase [Nitrospirota bacterium]
MSAPAVFPTALVLSHLAFEDAGTLGDLMEERGFDLQVAEPALPSTRLPDPAEPDLVVVLGGPFGVYEEEAYPHIPGEIAFVERRLALKKPIIGICLGAQLMARALGARVYPSGTHEIGWKPLFLTAEGRQTPLVLLGEDNPMLHWHGDTFDLPPGIPNLARTESVTHQAFMVGNYGLALQFHPEIRAGDFERWLLGHAFELSARKIDLPALRAQTNTFGPGLASRSRAFFSRWLSLAGFP